MVTEFDKAAKWSFGIKEGVKGLTYQIRTDSIVQNLINFAGIPKLYIVFFLNYFLILASEVEL